MEVKQKMNEDINDIRRKIKKSLEENEKSNFIKPQDFGKEKNTIKKTEISKNWCIRKHILNQKDID